MLGMLFAIVGEEDREKVKFLYDNYHKYVLTVARSLLKEAGYPDGFDLELTVDEASSFYCREIMELAASMWTKIGVRTTITKLDENEYTELRRSGR